VLDGHSIGARLAQSGGLTTKEVSMELGLDSAQQVMHQLKTLEREGRITRNTHKRWVPTPANDLTVVANALAITAAWYHNRDPELCRLLTGDELNLRQFLVGLNGNGKN
jgi:hypothetical protein